MSTINFVSFVCLANSLFSKLKGDDESATQFCDFSVFDKSLNSLSKWSLEDPSFEVSTQAIKAFQQIHDCVKERPGNWQKYFDSLIPGNFDISTLLIAQRIEGKMYGNYLF